MSIGTRKKYNYTITNCVARTEITTVKDTTSYNRDRDIDMETVPSSSTMLSVGGVARTSDCIRQDALDLL